MLNAPATPCQCCLPPADTHVLRNDVVLLLSAADFFFGTFLDVVTTATLPRSQSLGTPTSMADD